MLDEIFGQDAFTNEICWCYSGPSVAKHSLPRKHDVILFYKIGKATFNQIRIPYQAKLSVGGKKSWASEEIDASEYEKKGKLLEDWWVDIPALQRNEKEKVGYATQKPIALMKRIIEMTTNEGDLVFDPMCGSGSTGHAALLSNRKFVGCDKSDIALEKADARLSNIANA